MASIRESLESQFDGLEEVAQEPVVQIDAPVVEAAADAPIEAEAGRARDEAGRFAPKIKEEVAVDPAAAPAVEAKPRPEPPKSWKPEKRAKWDGLDPEVAEYINQREEETSRGVEPLKKVWNVLQPFMGAIQETGMPPEAVVSDLMQTAYNLKTAAPHDKFRIWMDIGKAYGVPTQNLQGVPQQEGDTNPEYSQLAQELSQVRGTLTQFQQQQEMATHQQAQNILSDFAGSHEHYESVRQTMGRLINSGEATDLQQAYDKALRLNDSLWQQSQAQQREAEAKATREASNAAAKAARASAVSPRSATPGAAVTVNGANGRRATLEEAFNSISGRI